MAVRSSFGQFRRRLQHDSTTDVRSATIVRVSYSSYNLVLPNRMRRLDNLPPPGRLRVFQQRYDVPVTGMIICYHPSSRPKGKRFEIMPKKCQSAQYYELGQVSTCHEDVVLLNPDLSARDVRLEYSYFGHLLKPLVTRR